MKSSPSKLLLADRDPQVHNFFDRYFGPYFEIFSVFTGTDATSRLIDAGPFAFCIVSSELQGTSGLKVLEQAKELHCDTIRILLAPEYSEVLFTKAITQARVWHILRTPLDYVETQKILQNGQAQYEQQLQKRELLSGKTRDLKQELAHLDRLAQIGTLATGIGHEFNNLAVVSRSLADDIDASIRTQQSLREDTREDIQWIGDRIESYARQFMTLGEFTGTSIPSALDLCSLFSSTLETLQLLGRLRYVSIQYNCPDEPVFIEAVEAEITQVVMNLLNHAADAMKRSGERNAITLRVYRDLSSKFAIMEISEFATHLNFEVPETHFLERRPAEISSGLSLTVARNIIEAHGGQLSFGCSSQEGSWIRVNFPLFGKDLIGLEDTAVETG